MRAVPAQRGLSGTGTGNNLVWEVVIGGDAATFACTGAERDPTLGALATANSRVRQRVLRRHRGDAHHPPLLVGDEKYVRSAWQHSCAVRVLAWSLWHASYMLPLRELPPVMRAKGSRAPACGGSCSHRCAQCAARVHYCNRLECRRDVIEFKFFLLLCPKLRVQRAPSWLRAGLCGGSLDVV